MILPSTWADIGLSRSRTPCSTWNRFVTTTYATSYLQRDQGWSLLIHEPALSVSCKWIEGVPEWPQLINHEVDCMAIHSICLKQKHLCVQGAKYPIPGLPWFKLVTVPSACNVVWGYLQFESYKCEAFPYIWGRLYRYLWLTTLYSCSSSMST